MKKGLFSILAGALLVVGCQNYDDQFSNIESQITALASQVAGLSQVQSDLTALGNTVNSLQSSVGDTVDAALADGLADIDAAVASLEAATASAASSEDVAAIAEDIIENNNILDEILAQSSVFSGAVVVNSVATLDAYHSMGAALEIVANDVTINPTAEMDATKLAELSDVFKTITGDLSVTSAASTIAELVFNNLTGAASLTLEQAGKKNEVINLQQSMANLATSNSRQVFSQVAGLNIYQNDDAGLQLHIGGRGLDPNRTSNFNTRQNGYDISADVLGYPESYYTPPAEALSKIEVLRGAASLQYGTQFGGLVNFVFQEANPEKPFTLKIRNTIGSNNLFTNFTSTDGTIGKFDYMAFFNLKKGDGFRENSKFNSSNLFLNIGYTFNEKTKISSEITYLNYLAQQGGGLTDSMFSDNPFQSNRSRNWFELDWLLYSIKLKHSFSKNSNVSFNFFGLNASRNSIGFRSNRVSQEDPNQERDLIKGDFNNFGAEGRWVKNYLISKKKSILLIGSKYYRSFNTSLQGPGSSGTDADFNLKNDLFPFYSFQSTYEYPNENIALFSENIFYLTDRLSITPGIRLEYIKTQSDGFYKKINRDAAGNVIFDSTVLENDIRKRTFILTGLGSSYKISEYLESYLNISQNFRSVTFADISIFNPAYTINPLITDEKGYTTDIGLRGVIKEFLSYDLSLFNLKYNNRIGFIQRVLPDGNIKSERGNVGDALIYGVESLVEFNLKSLLSRLNRGFILNYFVNYSYIDSEYIRSEEAGVEGKKVEFVPNKNLKTGLKFGYKNLLMNLQYSYLSEQFTDSSNAINGNLSGLIGIIPSYGVMDFSTSYLLNNIRIETGINNLLNTKYFNRRATGYPGPGIIPSAPRTYYITLQYKL